MKTADPAVESSLKQISKLVNKKQTRSTVKSFDGKCHRIVSNYKAADRHVSNRQNATDPGNTIYI